MNEHQSVPLDFSPKQHIRKFAEIPDILTLDIPPVEHIVPALGISRNAIVLWTGQDGDGKTYLAQAMGKAVARGEEFLGMPCQKSPVLYLDLENAAHVVQSRFRALLNEEAIPELRVWGIWNEQQPPQVGSELLLTIAKEAKPLIIVDPFRYFHGAEENDSTEMAGVMQYLRALAACGCSVILLHHPAKTEGSTGRGSSVIRGACDLAFLHSLDKESSLITLKVDKNRNGEARTITIRADFENGSFVLSESPYIAKRNEQLARLAKIIEQNPGLNQTAIFKQSGMQRNRTIQLLEEGTGTRWTAQAGPRNSRLYYSCTVVPPIPTCTGITGIGGAVVPVVPPPKGVDNGTAQLPPDYRCSTHGLHPDWFLEHGLYSCRRCQEGR